VTVHAADAPTTPLVGYACSTWTQGCAPNAWESIAARARLAMTWSSLHDSPDGADPYGTAVLANPACPVWTAVEIPAGLGQ
jgi:hypothetical protein